MPIINKPVVPFVQPPYRGKIVAGGGLRNPEDWAQVFIHFEAGSAHFICHQKDCSDAVVVEIHDALSKDGTHAAKTCRMEYFPLSPSQRYELAVYLLSTIDVRGK